MSSPHSVSVVIPTFNRGPVLVETVQSLLAQSCIATEILVVDQTATHDEATAAQLARWQAEGDIRWIRQSPPSIVHAMNRGLLEATSEIVLFLDDDIVPDGNLVRCHTGAHERSELAAVVGQVLQPGEDPAEVRYDGPTAGLMGYLAFPFYSTQAVRVENVMAGNLSVRRDRAMAIGGFDENFVGSAYRFETEFARRLCRAGGTILFEPNASIRHLRTSSGGTRDGGAHVKSASPMHGVGDYYYALTCGSGVEVVVYIVRRFFREVRTRFHLTHPWWIPVKWLGELRAIWLAVRLYRRGPSLVDAE